MEVREKKKLSTSQRQAVISLIEKKERDKWFIKNWRPISLLIVDYKIVAKALAARLEETLPKLISLQQSFCEKGSLVKEEGSFLIC